jgi:hypothetical protein
MGEVALAIVGVIAIAVIFIRKGFPRYLEYKKEIALAKINAHNEDIAKEAEERKTWQSFIGNRIDEIEEKIERLFSAISVHEQFSNKISEGTLVNQLFSDELWPFLRLKAFRRLLAMRRNGRVWDKGFSLILNHKDIWLDVLDTELGITIEDEKYYYARLDDIRKRIFDDMSYVKHTEG